MILVVGDAMTDEYWYGEVSRISPEAPVPVVKVLREEERPGAVLNIVANIKAMGGEAVSACVNTARKIRLVARGQQVARIDFDHAPEESEIASMLREYEKHLPGCSVVLFSDYAKGSLANVQWLITQAKYAGKTVLVDPKGHDFMRYAGADLLKPNESELREMIGHWADDKEMVEKVRELIVGARLGGVLVTRDARGMVLVTPTDLHVIRSNISEARDVTGAGEAAIAAFAVSIDRGDPWIRAINVANKAAGVVCGKFGVAVATEDEVFGTA